MMDIYRTPSQESPGALTIQIKHTNVRTRTHTHKNEKVDRQEKCDTTGYRGKQILLCNLAVTEVSKYYYVTLPMHIKANFNLNIFAFMGT